MFSAVTNLGSANFVLLSLSIFLLFNKSQLPTNNFLSESPAIFISKLSTVITSGSVSFATPPGTGLYVQYAYSFLLMSIIEQIFL